jgi:hypothetical protein
MQALLRAPKRPRNIRFRQTRLPRAFPRLPRRADRAARRLRSNAGRFSFAFGAIPRLRRRREVFPIGRGLNCPLEEIKFRVCSFWGKGHKLVERGFGRPNEPRFALLQTGDERVRISLDAACRDGRGRDPAAAVEDVSVEPRGGAAMLQGANPLDTVQLHTYIG